MPEAICCPTITIQCTRLYNIANKKDVFCVRAFSPDGESVFEGHTDECGVVSFPAQCGIEYHIIVDAPKGLNPGAAHRWFSLSDEESASLSFVFSRPCWFCPIKKTILLTDRYYSGHPISKGEIYLWQVPI